MTQTIIILVVRTSIEISVSHNKIIYFKLKLNWCQFVRILMFIHILNTWKDEFITELVSIIYMTTRLLTDKQYFLLRVPNKTSRTQLWIFITRHSFYQFYDRSELFERRKRQLTSDRFNTNIHLQRQRKIIKRCHFYSYMRRYKKTDIAGLE